MRNKFILALIILLASSQCSFAVNEGKVISDSAKQKEILDSFSNLNPYANNFFTPHIKKDVKGDYVEDTNMTVDKTFNNNSHGTTPPVKKLRIMLQNRNKPKAAPAVEDTTVKDQALLNCDSMEYFADKTELEADGHVVMVFPQNNSTIKADKMIYNQTSNLIKAYGNVVLISEGKELLGDYMQVDLNEENAIMDNPVTGAFQIKAVAKKGYMYGDKIIQEQGSLAVTKKTIINLKAEMFGPDLSNMYVPEEQKSYYMKEGHGEKFKIKTNDLIINSKKEHDTVTLKHAEVYFEGKKLGTIPSITMHTNKAQDYVEANFPELGTMTNLGLYAGPGFVFDTPKGTTLKVVPMLNYQGNSDTNDSSFGFGAIAKFKSANNHVDFAYGTANKMFLMRGKERLDDNLYFQYGSNTFLDDWFLGYRMPRLMGELYYENATPYKNFLGKNMDMTFTHRIAAAYVQDGNTNPDGGQVPLGEDGIGTMRFKYMAEVAQTLYKYGDIAQTPINARFEIVGQTNMALYGTGDTQAIARIGPRIHTQYKRWMQDVGYFLSGYNDRTPLVQFDQYMYGRSNVYAIENFRLCKYLTVSWLGSLNLLQDSWDGKMLQENMFFFAIGPDDIKLNIGYDTVRQQSFVTMAMYLDAKGATIDYKKMIIKNPNTLGKDKNKENNKQQNFSPSNNEDEDGLQRAEVIDIPGEEL